MSDTKQTTAVKGSWPTPGKALATIGELDRLEVAAVAAAARIAKPRDQR
jgi:hypothetical protein